MRRVMMCRLAFRTVRLRNMLTTLVGTPECVGGTFVSDFRYMFFHGCKVGHTVTFLMALNLQILGLDNHSYSCLCSFQHYSCSLCILHITIGARMSFCNRCCSLPETARLWDATPYSLLSLESECLCSGYCEWK